MNTESICARTQPLTKMESSVNPRGDPQVRNGPDPVEREALTACSVALLTVYDMCKAMDRG